MNTFVLVDPVTGATTDFIHNGAENWSRAEWDMMAKQAVTNPGLAGTVSADGILKVYNDIVLKGKTPTYWDVALHMGGFWTSEFTPSTIGTVTLEEGEIQTPEGVQGPNYIPPPTISGSIPPGPTSNTDTNAPTTTPINPNVTILPPTTATGGSGSSGSAIPQLSPAGTVAPVVTAPTTTPTTPNNNTMLLLLVAAVVVLYFVAE